MILDPGLVLWMIDIGLRPSVVDDRYRNLTYMKLFTERSSKFLEDLRCNSALSKEGGDGKTSQKGIPNKIFATFLEQFLFHFILVIKLFQ